MSDQEARAIVVWFMEMLKSVHTSAYDDVIDALLDVPVEAIEAADEPLPEPFARAMNEYAEAHHV